MATLDFRFASCASSAYLCGRYRPKRFRRRACHRSLGKGEDAHSVNSALRCGVSIFFSRGGLKLALIVAEIPITFSRKASLRVYAQVWGSDGLSSRVRKQRAQERPGALGGRLRRCVGRKQLRIFPRRSFFNRDY